MTLSEAYDRLNQRWPTRPFSIGVQLWNYGHKRAPAQPTIEWSIWDGEEHVHYEAPTLEGAMEQALGCDADLGLVDRQLVPFPDGSGYEITGRLTRVKGGVA